MIDASSHEVVLLAAGCSRRLEHLTRRLPKSLLEVGGRRIIDRSLDSLESLGFESVTMVVGYLSDVLRAEVGEARGRLRIRYVESPDYATTGHGWSLYRTGELLRGTGRPVLLLHADVVYDPRILQRICESAVTDAVAVDDAWRARTGDEVLVFGGDEAVTSIRPLRPDDEGVLGELVGITRWSAAYMEELFAFMDGFFAKHGPGFNWEPVVDAWLATGGRRPRPVRLEGLPWVNVNYEEDLQLAEQIVGT